MRVVIGCIGTVVLLWTSGCVDERQVYIEPATRTVESAKLQGAWGAYIEEIDGARVDGAQIRLSNFGHNSVQVSKGVHRIVVMQEISSGRSYTQVTNRFSFRCDAGHTYEFGPDSFWRPSLLKVTDKATGQFMNIQGTPVETQYLFNYIFD